MKLKSIRNIFGGYGTALMITAAMPAALAEVTVDGTRDTSDTGYVEKAVQTTTSNWGLDDTIANLHTTQDGAKLAVFIGGRVKNDPFGGAIILFIDSKPGGKNFIPNNLMTSGGEEYTINNFGTSASTGMTFEDGFNPDYAVRIYGNPGGNEAHVNRYDLQAGNRAYVGQTVASFVAPNGFISEIATSWFDTSTPNSDVTKGVEMKLSLAALGVPAGAGQTIKLMAILVNDNSSYASNQVIPPRTSSTDDIGNGINSINFETEPGIQTITVTVDNLDSDGDGDPDVTDPDDDNDGLSDTVENNSGVYVSPTQTGTNPLIEDTDGDTYPDGDEVSSTLGYISNPNIPNYLSMAVPGNFTTPQWKEDGSAGNAMTQAGTSLTDQYVWKLDYRFITAGPIAYKFAANGIVDGKLGRRRQ